MNTSRTRAAHCILGALGLALAAAPGCTPEASVGYWKGDLAMPAGPASSAGAGTSGSAGALAGRDGAGSEAMPMSDASIGLPVAGSAADAQVGMPMNDAGVPPATDGSVCDPADSSTLLEELTVDPAAVAYFAGGAELPAGRYRVAYVDGCRKFNSFTNSGWTVHGTPASLIHATQYSIVTGSEADFLMVAPGTFGLMVGDGGDPYGAFDTYQACVSANLLVPPADFDFEGGTLGILDGGDGSPFDDVSGTTEGGRNPTFRLTLAGCP
jgi:hypothetical protein